MKGIKGFRLFKIIMVPLFAAAALAGVLAWPVYMRGDQLPPGPPPARYSVGQEVPPEVLEGAVSLSAGKRLALDNTYNLFFSNVPEMPIMPGVLCRADDVLPPSGMVRVLFSHMNLLIDWESSPMTNMPATAGFAVENRTGRRLDVYAVRGAMAASRALDGTHLFNEDAAPVRPGSGETLYFGSAVGNYIIRQWFLSEDRSPVKIGSVDPGARTVVSGNVGPRGWIAGLYDLKFIDSKTGRQIGKKELSRGESVGIKTFIAPLDTDIDYFLDQPHMQRGILPLRENDLVHMRGLFVPGSYPDNPGGEAVSKKFTVNYDSGRRQAASFALASGEEDQGEDPGGPGYVPDVFLNDRMRNGADPWDGGRKGVNGGNYGVEYTVDLNLTGPAALVVQGAMHTGVRGQEMFLDLYNQILTVWLDGNVSTLQIKDPNYEKFYSDPSSGSKGLGM